MTGLTSPTHIALLLVVLLLVFGAKRLPELGHSLGHGMREFKDSLSGASPVEHPGSDAPLVPPAHLPAAPAPLDTRLPAAAVTAADKAPGPAVAAAAAATQPSPDQP